MAFTGQNFSDLIDITSDLAYGTYFDPSKKNALIKESLIKMVSMKYAGLDTQAEYDEILKFLASNITFAVTSNAINVTPTGAIADYFHLLAIKPTFTKVLTLNVVSATNATPIVVTFDKKSILRSKSYVTFAGATANTSLNGSRYLKQLNDYKYGVYFDINLLTPVPGNGTLAGTVTTTLNYNNNYCTQLRSGEKGNGFSDATVFKPMFEMADSSIKIYPNTEVCPSAVVDYVRKPLDNQLPDITNNAIDLELTYSIRFLYYWVDEIVKLYGEQMREYSVVQAQQQEIIQP